MTGKLAYAYFYICATAHKIGIMYYYFQILGKGVSISQVRVQMHWRRMCESYFPNSSRPISYLGFIWDLYVLGLKTKVLPDTFSHPMDSQCKNSADFLTKNTPNTSNNFCPISLPKPKTLGIVKKSSLWVSIVQVQMCPICWIFKIYLLYVIITFETHGPQKG